MAKIRPGGLVGQISGSIGGDTFSRNKGGPYVRNRAIPVTSTTDAAMAAKNRLALASQQWQALQPSERLAWETWAQQRTITDRLGEQIQLSGHQSFVTTRTRQELSGDPLIDLPPVLPPPTGLTELSVDATFAAETLAVDVTFAPELSVNTRLWIWAAATASAGVNYVQNLLRLVAVTDANESSPYDVGPEMLARLGDIELDYTVHVQAQVYDLRTGLLSGVRRARDLVTENGT